MEVLEIAVFLLGIALRVIILPVITGYVIQRAVSGILGKALAVLGALAVAYVLMTDLMTEDLRIPGK